MKSRVICKSQNGESGNRKSGMMGTWGIWVELWGIKVGLWGNQGGNAGYHGGNAGNQGENAGNRGGNVGNVENQDGNVGNQDRNAGNRGGNAGNQGGNARNQWGMGEIRVGMQGIREIICENLCVYSFGWNPAVWGDHFTFQLLWAAAQLLVTRFLSCLPSGWDLVQGNEDVALVQDFIFLYLLGVNQEN